MDNNTGAVDEGFDAFLGSEPMEELGNLDLGNDFTPEPEVAVGAEPEPQPEPEAEPEPQPEPETEPEAVTEDTTDAEALQETVQEPDEATSDDGADSTQADKKPGIQIPKSRFDKERQRRQELEKRLAELQTREREREPVSQDIEIPQVDVSEKTKAALEKALDGDAAAAAAMFNEAVNEAATQQTQAAIKQLRADLTQSTSDMISARTMQERVSDVISRAEDTYDVINEGSENYNPEIVNQALAFQAGYMDHANMPADLALDKGLEDALKLAGIYNEGDVQDSDPAPVADPKPTPKVSPEAIEKKTELANRQPPKLQGKTDREVPQTPNIMQMSEKDFNDLTETELKKLRGDFV